MSAIVGRDCARHRDVLVAFVDRRETGPGTDDALDHLERCRTCVRELQETALAIAGLRRLGRETAWLEPPPDAWARLRARIERPAETLWRWRAALAGLALSGALVAMLIGPRTLWTPRQVHLQEAGVIVATSQVRLDEEREESRAIELQRTARAVPPASPQAQRTRVPSAAEVGWPGPDGVGIREAAAEAVAPVERTK